MKAAGGQTGRLPRKRIKTMTRNAANILLIVTDDRPDLLPQPNPHPDRQCSLDIIISNMEKADYVDK